MQNLVSHTMPSVSIRKSQPRMNASRTSDPQPTAARNRAARAADPSDTQSLVEANMRLAPYGVQRFLGRYHIPAAISLDSDDLISEAFLALCQAAESWDPARG